MSYEKEKKINSCPGHSYSYAKICRPDAAQERRNTERADQVSGPVGWAQVNCLNSDSKKIVAVKIGHGLTLWLIS